MLAGSTRVSRRAFRGLIRHARYSCCLTTPVSAARCRLLSTVAGDRTTPETPPPRNALEVQTVGDRAVTKGTVAVQTETSTDGRFVTLQTDGDDVGRFHAIWLRHNCQCPACCQRFSGQKLIRPAELAPSYSVQWAGVDADDRLVYVNWNEEEHRSEFPVSFLRQSVHVPAERRRVTSTPSGGVAWLPTVDFDEILRPAGRLRWLQMIAEVGIVLLRGVPPDAGMVRVVAELMAPIQRTIYGETWDVLANPEPINVAYSDAELDFHMDLSYYESPPGIQFLHCLRFDDCVTGGESVFVDAWHVAEMLRATYPDYFSTLTRVPATFQKIHFDRDYPVYMKYRRPHIITEPEGGRIVGVTWAPAFEGVLNVPEADIEPYYEAYTTFARLLDESATRLETRLQPGELACFNNRRVMHARHSFQLNGGVRHLRGCYVNIDEFKSRLYVLAIKAGAERVSVRHVFNQCWS